METIRGRTSRDLDLIGLEERLANHTRIFLDLGTGDGRYVHSLAEENPNHFILGVDTCRENLREYSRAKLPNMLFIIANAQSLPHELHGLVSHVAINFPWGSLLDGLLTADTCLMRGLESIAGSTMSLDIRLNGGALTEAGWTLEAGARRIHDNLVQAGWYVRSSSMIKKDVLRKFPSTWAKRLAVGRDPRAIEINSHVK